MNSISQINFCFLFCRNLSPPQERHTTGKAEHTSYVSYLFVTVLHSTAIIWLVLPGNGNTSSMISAGASPPAPLLLLERLSCTHRPSQHRPPSDFKPVLWPTHRHFVLCQQDSGIFSSSSVFVFMPHCERIIVGSPDWLLFW